MGQTKYALVIEYFGRNFSGFQTQRGRHITVQEELEKALSALLRSPMAIEGAARTDAGVHATAQVVTFCSSADLDAHTFLWSLNALIRPDIVARSVSRVPHDFDPRRSATGREYAYLILNRPHPSPFLKEMTYWYAAPLDHTAMDEAAQHLIGTHDFTSFCSIKAASEKSTVRKMENLGVSRVGDVVVIRLRANAFLHNMVRIIAGTLLEVGAGSRSPGDLADILRARQRQAAGITLAAHGLFLTAIDYPRETTEGADLGSYSSDLKVLLGLLLD